MMIQVATAQNYCTIAYAAEVLGVSIRQVGRYVSAGQLTGHRPRVGSRESARHKVILDVEEVLRFRDARDVIKGTRDA